MRLNLGLAGKTCGRGPVTVLRNDASMSQLFLSTQYPPNSNLAPLSALVLSHCEVLQLLGGLVGYLDVGRLARHAVPVRRRLHVTLSLGPFLSLVVASSGRRFLSCQRNVKHELLAHWVTRQVGDYILLPLIW